MSKERGEPNDEEREAILIQIIISSLLTAAVFDMVELDSERGPNDKEGEAIKVGLCAP